MRRGASASFPWEIGAAAAVTTIAILLDVRFALHAGGLWRDEAATAHFATLPTIGEIVSRLHLDNFPGLSLALIRLWSAIFGPTDASYRVLGLVISLGVLAAIWAHGTWIGRRTVPWAALLLFALNPVVIRALGSIRPYGLGAAFIVLSHAAIWAAAVRPSPGRIAVAALVAICAVQCLYQNAILLGGIGLAASIALAARRRREAWIPLAIGAVAALSIVPYLPFVRRAQDWSILNRHGVDLQFLVSVFGSMLSSAGPAGIALAVAAVSVALIAGLRAARAADDGRSLYGVLSIVAATAGFLAFLRVLRMPTQMWYYVLPSAVAAVSIDMLLAGIPRSGAWRAAAAAIVAAAVLPGAWTGTAIRQTDADLVAATLRASASPGDLVLVRPWHNAISLSRYYSGPAAVVTIPPLTDFTIHRYDLVKARMQESDPMAPLQPRIEKTLREGGSVWFVGDLELPPRGARIQALPPAPTPPWGWNEDAYVTAWATQAAGWLRADAVEVREVKVVSGAAVEPLPVHVFSGWRRLD